MKKLILFGAGACLVLACSQPSQQPVDKEAAKQAVTAMLDAYEKAFASEDAAGVGAALTEDGIFYGTDPSEAWTRDQVLPMIEQFKADTAVSIAFTESSRTVTVSANGNDATVVTQGIYPFISSIVVTRFIGHAINVNGTWKFDMISYAFVPRNDDVPKINAALK